ncbi:inositol monophosphatase family protein [Coxiella endosymbiont of Amblyomma nuttalli]|uniref:inositol monophosphatase family protein n=1 Tax=Coxiella endosymbiont of Amblyomma nuttalli TaxID=2749996 RepID=UPI001BACBD75|nr:inositol monophosphatase family protein [Coxiella endosymbiont of Amblyomma nuttalli]QTS83952.1 Inositol-1-monophosphatase [Coxiella endosymbiont of Amblyomma nuttalli]
MNPALNIAIQAVRRAGRIIVRFVDRLDTVNINEKKHNDFVTQVDELSEQEIIQTLRKAYPSHSILAEESGFQKKHEDYTWIIDPLDGTTNFIHGFPHFAISIALRHRDKLEVAAIYDPLRQELFTAVRGSGAQLNSRKIRVSACQTIHTALVGTGFPFKDKEFFPICLKIFEAIFSPIADIRCAGSTALDLAYISSGRLDGFWAMSLKPWNIAAGVLLITEAGGFTTDFQEKNNYMKNRMFIAGNPKVHKLLLEIISKIVIADINKEIKK